jgi:2-keto-3-deoxy-L-rhamnonate aldolase RhmA
MNRLREKVNHLEKSCGTIVCMSDPALCEILGNAGYDYIWIDMEHTHLSYRDVLTHISTCRAAGVSSLVRVPQNDLTATKKVLQQTHTAVTAFVGVERLDALSLALGFAEM